MSHAARYLPSQVRPGHPTQPLEVIAFLGLLSVVFPGVALGETPLASSRAAPPVQAGPNVVPPHLIEQTAVPYPDGAEGDALVVVVVTVNADGTVRSARAQAEMPPFSDAAVRAVQGWRFEPATRDKVRIAALIRLQIGFHASVVRDVEDEAPATAVTAPPQTPSERPAISRPNAASSAAEPPLEVTVVGEKRAPMVVSLARTEVRQIPGTFGDPFRALEILPGVTPILSGVPFFYVRGAPPGNVGYYLDGIRVPYLFHVAIGPSVIHPGMVDRVDLYPGGYPARYGRYAGGIAAAETTAPNATTHGEGGIRLYDAGALVETGFHQGRGTVLLGGRYSYTAALISLLAKGVTLDYRDYQARIAYDVTPKDRLSLVAFGAYDLLATETNGISTVGFGSEFYRGELRWDRGIGDTGRLRTALTLGYDQTAMGGMVNAQDRLFGARSEYETPLSNRIRLRTGLDAMVDSYRVTNPPYTDPDDPQSGLWQTLFPPRRDAVMGAHAELGIEVQRGFFVTPGLRLDYFMSGGATAVGIDPRLSAKLRLSDEFAILHAYGIAHQPPSFVIPVPGMALGSLANGLQTAYQTSAGIEWGLSEGTRLTANLFHNAFTHLTDALSVPESLSSDSGEGVNQRTRGRSYGIEVFLHRKLTQKLGGFVSYTLSRSTRRLGNSDFPAAFDRRHVLNTALAYNLGRNWRAGTRLTYYSGAPKRAANATAPVGSEAPTARVANDPLIANPPRDPGFYRIDVRLEKLWQLGKSGHISFVAEVMNVTARKETLNGDAIGPIFIPSIGVEGGF